MTRRRLRQAAPCNGSTDLTAAVAVMHQTLGPGSRPQGLLQRVQHQVRAHGLRHPPANDPAGEDINDKRYEYYARPGGDVGKVRDPQLVRHVAVN